MFRKAGPFLTLHPKSFGHVRYIEMMRKRKRCDNPALSDSFLLFQPCRTHLYLSVQKDPSEPE